MTYRMTRLCAILGAIPFSIAFSSDAQAVDPRLNEIRVDQPGLDLSEYLEIRGTAGQSLAGYTLLAIGDDDGAAPPAQNGSIEAAIALKGTIGASGFFVLAEASFALGTADQTAVLNFENPDDVTFLLVTGFTGANGDDLDTDDDGVLDSAPWTAIVDSVALLQTDSPDGMTADFVYSTNRVGPDGATSPSHTWRCEDGNGWRIGAADPVGGSDSPGAANATCGSAITIRISEIRIDQPGTDNDEYIEIEGTPGASLNGYTYVVIGDNNTTGAVDLAGSIESITPLDGAVIPADGLLLIGKATMVIATPDFVVPATAMNFENSDNVTHFLVAGFTGLLNGDVDVGNDCILDAAAPWASVIDSVALTGLDTTCVYSTSIVGPDVTHTTAHAFRCFSAGTWSMGAYDHLAGGDSPGTQNRACGLPPILECGELGAGSCTTPHANPYCDDQVCCTLICVTQPSCCFVTWDAACAAAAAVSCNQSGGASCERAAVSFSEIRIDHPGTDTDEWVEFVGAPGTSMAGLTMIVIGDGTGLSGTIEAVVSLGTAVIPADGHYAISEATFTQGIANIDLVLTGTNPLNFENSDNVTFMLVQGFTGANAQDLDTNDDGVLDVTPWASVNDTIALIFTTTVPPVGTEWFYGPNTIGPDVTFVPGHIWRCEATGCWNIGPFDIIAAHDDTPGVANEACALPCPGDYDGNGARDGADLTTLLSAWGTPGGDITGDGQSNGADLTTLLSGWGQCPQ
ncbi:MAG: hypothetical protein EXS15_00020 [Phycisphaerales bacterium]|nr:hypothetical protein [Phycisphaerales bacterium]